MNVLNSTMRVLALALVASAVLAGCGGSQGSDGATTVTVSRRSGPKVPSDYTFAPLPGLPVSQLGPEEVSKVFTAESRLVAGRYGTARSDPFSLKASEKRYETEQNTARLMGQMGGMTVLYTPEPERSPTEGLIQDPQPYRRLSGIIVGDSVYAIMDSGGGKSDIIRPGMRVPGTEWDVVSIDTEKAVLRRRGNKVPREIVVRLETSLAPPSGGASGAGFGPGGPGAPGGPGFGPPGGGPGGPGGSGRGGGRPGPGGPGGGGAAPDN